MKPAGDPIIADASGFRVTRPVPLRDVTARYLAWCTEMAGGNRTKAAELAGVTDRTVSKYVGKKHV